MGPALFRKFPPTLVLVQVGQAAVKAGPAQLLEALAHGLVLAKMALDIAGRNAERAGQRAQHVPAALAQVAFNPHLQAAAARLMGWSRGGWVGVGGGRRGDERAELTECSHGSMVKLSAV